MSDPISPTGSQGQLVPMAPSPAPPPPQNAGGGGVSASQESLQPQASSQVAPSTLRSTRRGGQGQNPPASEQRTQSAPVSVDEAAKAMQDYLKSFPSDLVFRKDEESGVVIFKVVNPLTGEVIRQYPPEELLQMARKFKALDQSTGSGILLDKKL